MPGTQLLCLRKAASAWGKRRKRKGRAGRSEAWPDGEAGCANCAGDGGGGHDEKAAAAVVEAGRGRGVDRVADEANCGGDADGKEHEIRAAAAADEARALRVVQRLQRPQVRHRPARRTRHERHARDKCERAQAGTASYCRRRRGHRFLAWGLRRAGGGAVWKIDQRLSALFLMGALGQRPVLRGWRRGAERP